MTEPALPPDLQRSKDEATVAQAQAAVEKAQVDVEKAKADAAKAQADAANSKAAVDKLRAELADYDAPYMVQQREAAARVEQLKALIPDLGKITPNITEVKEGTPPLLGSVLTYQALERAAILIAGKVVVDAAGFKL